MRVVHLIDNLSSSNGGPQSFLLSFIEEVGDANSHFIWVTGKSRLYAKSPAWLVEFFGYIEYCKSLQLYYVSFSLRGAKLSKLPHLFILLRNILKSSVLHVHGCWSSPGLIGWLAKLCWKVPYIISPHGMLCDYSLSVNSLKKTVALLLYQQRIICEASLIHFASEFEYMNSIRTLPPSMSIKIMSLPVDRCECLPASFPRNFSSLEICKEPLRLIFLGRVTKGKGFPFLLDVLKSLPFAKFRLLLVGPLDSECKDLLDKLELSNPAFFSVITVAGMVSRREVPAYLASSDLLVSPTDFESYGLAIREALCVGLPIFTTPYTSFSDLIVKREYGFIAPLDKDIWYNTLFMLVRDKLPLVKCNLNLAKLRRTDFPAYTEFLSLYFGTHSSYRVD